MCGLLRYSSIKTTPNLNKLSYTERMFFDWMSRRRRKQISFISQKNICRLSSPRIIKHKISHFINYRNNAMVKIPSAGQRRRTSISQIDCLLLVIENRRESEMRFGRRRAPCKTPPKRVGNVRNPKIILNHLKLPHRQVLSRVAAPSSVCVVSSSTVRWCQHSVGDVPLRFNL